MSTTIRIDDDVEAYIHQHGKFGESHSDVLRRLLPNFERKPVVYPKPDSRTRYPKLFGHSTCAVIRWMGQEGWSFKQARQVLDSYENGVNDITVRAHLNYTTQNRGEPAKLTPPQIKELTDRKKAR